MELYRLFVLDYLNQDDNSKRFKAKGYYLPRRIIDNWQTDKLNLAVKNKTGTILTLNKKNFEAEELLHKLFLTTRQKTKRRNAFANNMSTDIKRRKAQMSKIIQPGRSFGSWLGNLGKKALRNIAIL